MNKQYNYPLDLDWNHAEIAAVMRMWQVVEQAYEVGITCENFQLSYRDFKQVVPSKGEEKRLGREFEKNSSYSLYRVGQRASQQGSGRFKMNEKG